MAFYLLGCPSISYQIVKCKRGLDDQKPELTASQNLLLRCTEVQMSTLDFLFTISFINYFLVHVISVAKVLDRKL